MSATEAQWTSAEGLLPRFLRTSDVKPESVSEWAIAPIIPESVRISAMRSLHPDYMLCLLGGGPACRFNNLWMAQSAARLASGTQITATITATLEKREHELFSALPAPLDQREWINAHLFKPLFEVGITGTGKDMKLTHISDKCASLASSDCYLVLYKTGTLDEGTAGRESESLLFVIGLWHKGAFVRGSTLAGFIYMEDDEKKKPKNNECSDCGFNKLKFSSPIMRDIAFYLQNNHSGEHPLQPLKHIETLHRRQHK